MADSLDALFKKGAEMIALGNAAGLSDLLKESPELVCARLEQPGEWLVSRVGPGLDGYFEKPYLLWFVPDDAQVFGRLPADTPELAGIILDAARHCASFQEQIDYTLQLVCWSGVAKKSGVQIPLIDLLAEAGAKLEITGSTLVNRNLDAAMRLLELGAPLTPEAAVCLGRADDAAELLEGADDKALQTCFILAALNGQVPALKLLLDRGVDVNVNRSGIYEHGSALHHAVWSGSLEAVRLLIDAGADLEAKDTAYGGTPLGWAEYGERTEIAKYLRSLRPT